MWRRRLGSRMDYLFIGICVMFVVIVLMMIYFSIPVEPLPEP